jgi:hypothetical protein
LTIHHRTVIFFDSKRTDFGEWLSIPEYLHFATEVLGILNSSLKLILFFLTLLMKLFATLYF